MWDVGVYRVLADTVLFLLAAVLGGTLWVFAVQLRQRWNRYRLEREKERYALPVALLLECEGGVSLESLRQPPETPGWQAVEALMLEEMPADPGPRREYAIQCFEGLGYVDFYLDRLRRANLPEKVRLIGRLGRLGSLKSVPVLLEVLNEEHPAVRKAAVQALGRIRDPRAIPALIGLLRDVAFGQEKHCPRRLLMAALISYGSEAVPFLIYELSDPEDAARVLAAEVLIEIPHRLALRSLIRALDDANPEVRSRAACALGRIGHPLAVRPLRVLLSDPFWYVRLQAARALGEIGSPRPAHDLLLLLTDSHLQVRSAAADSLLRIRPSVLPVLALQILYTADRYAREQVCMALQRFGVLDRWVDDLGAADVRTAEYLQSVLAAAARVGALNSLLDALHRHPDLGVRKRLIGILGQSSHPASVRAIHRLSLYDEHPDIREKARQTVRRTLFRRRMKGVYVVGNHR